jgi:hypothetical protein
MQAIIKETDDKSLKTKGLLPSAQAPVLPCGPYNEAHQGKPQTQIEERLAAVATANGGFLQEEV